MVVQIRSTIVEKKLTELTPLQASNQLELEGAKKRREINYREIERLRKKIALLEKSDNVEVIFECEGCQYVDCCTSLHKDPNKSLEELRKAVLSVGNP